MPDDELSQLFPDLAPILANWGNYGGGGQNGLPLDEHGGVTDEAMEQYIQTRMSNGQRVGPTPAVSGQQPPAQPQFVSGQGLHMPPPGGTEPAGDGVSVVPTPQPSPAAPPPQAPPSPAAPPSVPPAGTTPGVPAGGQPDQQGITQEQYDAYAQFDQMLQADPGLRDAITNHLRQRAQMQQPAPQPQPQPYYSTPQQVVPPQPVPSPYNPPAVPPPPTPTYPQPQQPPNMPQLPPISAEDLQADPVLAAIYGVVQQQQGLINNLQTNWQAVQQQTMERQQQEANALIGQRVSAFQQARALDDAAMQRVREEAGKTEALRAYMSSGMSASDAVDKVLDMAYWSIPEYRDAALLQQAQQQRDNAQRRQVAGTLSGSSGSVPRTPSAVPTDPRERQAELIGVVGEMMNGTYVSPE